MDKIIQIFTQLGVDSSIFYQFAVFVVIFAVLKYTFFNKLLFVIETREQKTTKMEEGANTKFQEAERMAKDFHDEIEKVNVEAQTFLSNEKQTTLKAEDAKMKEAEAKVNADYEDRKSAVVAEVNSQRDGVLKNATELSNELVNKLT